jgi:hypothetical protein
MIFVGYAGLKAIYLVGFGHPYAHDHSLLPSHNNKGSKKQNPPCVCGGFFQWIEMLDSLYIVWVCAYLTNFRNHSLGREFFPGFLE